MCVRAEIWNIFESVLPDLAEQPVVVFVRDVPITKIQQFFDLGLLMGIKNATGAAFFVITY